MQHTHPPIYDAMTLSIWPVCSSLPALRAHLFKNTAYEPYVPKRTHQDLSLPSPHCSRRPSSPSPGPSASREHQSKYLHVQSSRVRQPCLQRPACKLNYAPGVPHNPKPSFPNCRPHASPLQSPTTNTRAKQGARTCTQDNIARLDILNRLVHRVPHLLPPGDCFLRRDGAVERTPQTATLNRDELRLGKERSARIPCRVSSQKCPRRDRPHDACSPDGVQHLDSILQLVREMEVGLSEFTRTWQPVYVSVRRSIAMVSSDKSRASRSALEDTYEEQREISLAVDGAFCI